MLLVFLSLHGIYKFTLLVKHIVNELVVRPRWHGGCMAADATCACGSNTGQNRLNVQARDSFGVYGSPEDATVSDFLPMSVVRALF